MRPNNSPHLALPLALTPDEAAALVAFARDRVHPSAAHYPPSYRDNERLAFDEPQLADRLFERLRDRLPQTADYRGETWVLDGINPRLRICRYGDGQRFGIHRDGVHHHEDGRRSILTFLVYLNDASEFEGGDTRFFAGRRQTDPVVFRQEAKAGTLIVFDHTIWHDGAPVTAGEKFVLRSDLLYRRLAGPPEHAGHRGYVWRATPLPDGRIATGGRDKTVRIWDAQLREARVWRAHSASVTALAAGAGRLFTGSRDGSIRAWGKSAELVAETRLDGAVLDAAWVDATLLTAGADGCIRLWDSELRPTAVWRGHEGWVWRLAVDGDTVLSAGEDGTVRRWTPDGENTVAYRCKHPLTAVATSEAGFVSGDGIGTVRVHRERLTTVVADHRARVRDVREHNGQIYSAGEDDWVRVSDPVTGEPLRRWRHDDFVTSLCAVDGEVYSTSYDGGVRRLEVETVPAAT